jgi:hypothetical protein
MQAIMGLMSIHAAWSSLGRQLSLSTMYRLYKRIHARQGDIRTILMLGSHPPDTPDAHPLCQTLSHLKTLFANSDSPIETFQHHFQTPFL